jgi:hypothetical protein
VSTVSGGTVWINGVGEVDREDARLAYPVWSKILELPNGAELWQGGTHDDEDFLVSYVREVYASPREYRKPLVTPKDFDAVATLYAGAGPVSWEVAEYRFGFGDQPLDRELVPRIDSVVEWVLDELNKGHRVLVRCQAGLNRSGLITALTLCKLGYTGSDAIELIRKRRTRWALCNQDFELYVESRYPGE